MADGDGARDRLLARARDAEERVERLAGDVFHDDEDFVIGLDDVERRDDVRVADARREARLVEEHRDELGVARELGVHPFDGDRTRERVRAQHETEVHRRHPARGELTAQRIAADDACRRRASLHRQEPIVPEAQARPGVAAPGSRWHTERSMRSRARALLFVASLSAGAASGCSLVTSFDGIDLGSISASGDAAATIDAASDGGALADHEAAVIEAGDAANDAERDAADAKADTAPPFSCHAGGAYCGGDENGYTTDSAWLFVCNSAGNALTKTLECSHGCISHMNAKDVCSCFQGSPYCGGDQILGPTNVLYTCGAESVPQDPMTCANGCMVNAGANDACK